MGCTKIFKDNLFDSDIANALLESSAKAAFPASNTYAFERRTRVWRSDGYWAVTSSNNTIIIDEGGGDLTATITAANYTTDASFFTAIKTAMEDVGAQTYTIARSVTGLFTITSSGSSTLRLSQAGMSGFMALVGYPGSSVDASMAAGLSAPFLRLHSNEWIKIDCGLPTNPTAVIVSGLRNVDIKLSQTAVIKLQGNETDSWNTPSYNATLTYDAGAIYSTATAGLHTGPLRYWRIYFEDLTNPQLYIEISNVFLGFMLEQTRGALQFPLQSTLLDGADTIYSDDGQSYSNFREKSESFSVEWFGLTVAEKEDLEAFFKTVGTSKPFFVLLDANSMIASTPNLSLRYVKFSNQPRLDLVSPGNYRLTAEVREEL